MTGTLRSTVRQWWADPGDYQWLIAFLEARGLLVAFKRFVAILGAVMAALAMLIQRQPTTDHDPGAQMVLIGVIAFGVLWAVSWWFLPWPSPRRSILFIAGADVAIAAAVVLSNDPLTGLVGTPLFAVMGSYIVLFHTPKVHAVHIVFVTAIIGGLATWLALQYPTGGVELGIAKGGVALLLTVTILPVLQLLFWLIRNSTIDSLTDPLTGLINRRGLDGAVEKMRAEISGPLAALLIDLDDFKSVNDSRGHLAGDAVLVRTAARIRDCVHDEALVARLGGDEFLVLTQLNSMQGVQVGEKIRTAIAEPADPPESAVTASIGVAIAVDVEEIGIHGLISAADTAMYQAKRRGGNLVG